MHYILYIIRYTLYIMHACERCMQVHATVCLLYPSRVVPGYKLWMQQADHGCFRLDLVYTALHSTHDVCAAGMDLLLAPFWPGTMFLATMS